MPTPQESSLTIEQYRAIQYPVELPTPNQLFDVIVETLKAKGLATYKHADPFRNRLPQSGLFLLIPPMPAPFNPAEIMAIFAVDGRGGTSFYQAEKSWDKIDVPAGPYLMVDIEDGKTRLNRQPWKSAGKIFQEGRSPYTIWRGIVHGIVFSRMSMNHGMNLVGSGAPGPGATVPSLRGNDLIVKWDDLSDPEWGAPSCGSLIVP